MTTPAGWYADPYEPSQQRWWNGSAWGEQTQPVLPPVPAPPPIAPAYAPQYLAPSHTAPGAYVQPQFAAHGAGYHDVPVASVLAALPVVSPWGRFGAYLLEVLLLIVTLGIGWLVWAATLADKGQTPAKKMMGHRVIMDYSGMPATFSRMLFLRGFFAGLLANFAIPFTLGIVLLMPFWDSKNRNLWDHLSSSRVVYDPT